MDSSLESLRMSGLEEQKGTVNPRLVVPTIPPRKVFKNYFLRDTLRLPAATTQVPCTLLHGW